jgi:hypothetical protein
LDERLAEQEGGRVRRRPGRAAQIAPAVDRQRGERRRLVDEELRLPARAHAEGVEIRLVSDDSACDQADAGPSHLRGEAPDPERRQRRVAEPFEDEVTVPFSGVLLAHSDHLRLHPVAGPERHQGRVRDRELLVGGGNQRQGRIAGVHDLAALELDRDRGGTGDAGRAERPRELRGERLVRARRGGRNARGRERARNEDAEQPKARAHLPDSNWAFQTRK